MAEEHSYWARLANWWLLRFEGGTGRPRAGLPPQWLAGVLRRLATRELIEDIQLVRLRQTVAYAAARSPFYHDRLSGLGIDPNQVRSLEDLIRLPFTTAEDLAESEHFLCVPMREIGHVFTTSGTTGEPKRVYFTFKDFQSSISLAALALALQAQTGLRVPQHVVALIALPQGLWIGSHQALRTVEGLGGLALPVGMPDPEETLRHHSRFQPDALISSPSYMAALTRAAEERGLRLSVPYLLLGGEMLLAEQERAFAEFWQAQVVNVYGATETGGGQAIVLPGCRGFHLNEVGLLAEIVDPETGAASDHGELVFTTLARTAMPLLRYRTGDIGRWVECGCGLPLRSFVVERRIGDMFVVGSLNMYGRVIAEAIADVDGAAGRIEIALDKVGLADRLEVLVQRLPGREVSTEAARDALLHAYPDLARSLQMGALHLEIHVVDRLEPTTKAFRIRDRRFGKEGS